jgi:D-glycero-D-manno-heptose 1,7-bisphosphate phosphatase
MALMNQSHPAAFLDRDGVLNVDTGYPHRPDELVLTPTAAQAIARLNRAKVLAIVVTNQSGVARGLFDLAAVDRFHAALQARLGEQGAAIDAFYVAPWHPDGMVEPFNVVHDDRKPGPGMILRAMAQWPIDPARSVLFGDRGSDMEAARRAGIAGIRVVANTCDLDTEVRRWLEAGETVSKERT